MLKPTRDAGMTKKGALKAIGETLRYL